ncbi:Adaptive-response sensory-kinase SasA [Sporomusa silvacetica DSM 10669]|uniref:histidine kinase n=1 Tax=Sporomusa silvacetica DSM 10669 TaxID=1123289 RepID=A0ABZ3ISF1_9FIRM|nr:ATP-binding protein [Sporomusa silvacetica]OZC14643.1 sporulation kinase E [Sporomusa silvacetica DSM 10669]
MLSENLGPKLSDIIENIGIPIYTYDKNWRLSYINSAAEVLWGYSREELLGKVIWDIFPEAIGNRLDHEYHKAISERKEVCFETFATIQKKWLEIRACPVEDGLIVYAQDIDEKKKAQSEIKSWTRQLNQLIELCPLGILILDKEGIIETINSAYIQRFLPSLKKEECIGKSGRYISECLGVDWESTSTYNALNGKQILNYVETGPDWVVVSNAVPILDKDGNTIGAMGVFYDITEYERMKAEIAKLDRFNLVNEMAAGVAHEIRNPMTVIKGYLQYFSRKVPSDMIEQFTIVLNELERVEQLITNFLSLANNKAIERKSQNLNTIITQITPLILSDTNKRDIELAMVLDKGCPDLLLDDKEIKQLILNLVRNGLEAMSGHGILTIETSVRDDMVHLFVKDCGCGIDKEYLNKIYDPFFTTKANGTGLGLSVCAGIVRRHAGTIQVQSEAGQGTRFTIVFPTKTG